MVLNRASIARRSLQLPEGKRGKLSFDEMTSTLSMGRNVDTFQSITRTCAELAHGAWGSYAGGLAQVFTYRSFGTNPES